MRPHPMTRFLKDFARGPIPRAVRYHGPKGFRWEEVFKGHVDVSDTLVTFIY